jgi:hypothetical protein
MSLRVCLRRRRIARVYDRSASSVPLLILAEPVIAIAAHTMGPQSHVGDDLACFVAEDPRTTYVEPRELRSRMSQSGPGPKHNERNQR